MRLVDADAAIDAINSYFGFDGEYGSAVQEIINGLPSAHQWIPLSERWPDDDGVYLVTYKGVTNVALFAWGGWTIGTEDGMGQALPDAWMPLPEPYKEAENGE